MEEDQKISVTTQALIAILVQLGSVKRVREVANEYKLSKKEVDQLIETPQAMINDDEYSERQLALLKSIGKDILHTNKVIRFENRNKCLLVYFSAGSEVILEYVHSAQHTFSKLHNSLGLNEVVCDFYGVDSTLYEDPIKINIELSNDLYDSLHNMKPSKLDQMIEDEKYDAKIREFLNDFKWNNQQVCKIIFKKRKTKNSGMKVDFAMLFVSGKDYIWHLNYDESDNHQIFLMSNSVSHYFNVLESIMGEFLFNDSPQKDKNMSGKKEKEDENFSFKRGVTFFWQSNLVLLIAFLFFFINKSSWNEQGGFDVLLITLLSELVIWLCSFFACFKKKEDSPEVKRVKST
ncbi:hypothetical protein [Mesobacillus zeae]|uniref:hypothetical protein n=1 Tax=Mesobacillus zeae TaxID=1917180 RepID=UPI001FEB909A|nr:hypothetical protein [Mesobacillus zeae]